MISADRMLWPGLHRRTAALWVVLLALAAAVAGAAEPTVTEGDRAERIAISADELVVDSKRNSATFSGNVTAVQGGNRITADRMTVFYESGGSDTGTTAAGEGSIRRIESEGNVTIHFDDKVAVTGKAIYIKSSGLLELMGEGTRVTSGQNTITGERITVDRARDSITVVGGGSRRVEAVIFPDGEEGGLLPPSGTGSPDRPAP